MKHIIQIDISKDKNYYVAQGLDAALVTQAKTLDKLTRNLKEAIRLHLADPDAGLELTAKAKRRLAHAKRVIASGKKSNGITLEEFEKKYLR